MNKESVRKKALSWRDGTEKNSRSQWSDQIADRIFQCQWYKEAESVLSYASFRSEAETDRLNRQILNDGKKLYLPKTYMAEKCIRFYRCHDLKKLQKGYQGILEPTEKELFVPGEEKTTALMLMPGAAFDNRGGRIGYGGGYYDRFLNKNGEFVHSVMLAFAGQRVPDVYGGKFDYVPDALCTEHGFEME